MAIPANAEPARAQNSVTPKSLKKVAVIQSIRGGFSSQSWLGVTPTGTVGQPLVLTANPAGLAPGQYTAQVLVNSSTSGVTNVESIRVGLVVGASDPAALIELPGVSATFFATSPVEPWVFVSRGATVEVYDMYSGALVQTITTPAAAQGQLIVNGNGTRLYVVDSTSTQSKIYEMVIPSGAQSRTFISSNGWNDQFAYARPGAMPTRNSRLSPQTIRLR